MANIEIITMATCKRQREKRCVYDSLTTYGRTVRFQIDVKARIRLSNLNLYFAVIPVTFWNRDAGDLRACARRALIVVSIRGLVAASITREKNHSLSTRNHTGGFGVEHQRVSTTGISNAMRERCILWCYESDFRVSQRCTIDCDYPGNLYQSQVGIIGNGAGRTS